MARPTQSSTTANNQTNKQVTAGRVKDKRAHGEQLDELQTTPAQQDEVMVVAAAEPDPASSAAPSAAEAPKADAGVDGKDLDPAILVEAEPPAVGPALGIPAWGWAAGGAGAAAAAAGGGGGGGGDNTQATPSALPATPNARLSVDSGLSQTDGVTTSAAMVAPTNVAQGAKLEYKVDDGAWSTTYAEPATEGAHTVQVRQTGSDGRVSEVQTIQLTLDKTTPDALTVALKTDSGASGSDGITNSAELLITGAEAGALIEYSLDDGATWSSTLAAKDGANKVIVRQTDVAGNVSASSDAVTFTLDTLASAIPQALVKPGTLIAGAAGEASLVYVQDFKYLSFVAVAEEGVTRTYSVDGGAPSQSFIAPKGEGPHTITVTDTDVAGNVASKTFNVSVDITEPVAPVLSLQTDTGASSGDRTSKVGTLVLGQQEDKAVVEYSLDGSTGWGSSFAAKEGTNTVYVRQTDQAGNVSSSTKFQFTLDTVAPVAPVVKLQADTGLKADDGITSNAALNLSAENGAVVEYSVNGGASWSTSFTAKEGANSLLVRQTDLAGNVSPTSPLSFTLDTIKPATPALSLQADTGLVGNDAVTFNGAVSLTGAEAGAKVEYSIDNGVSWGTTFTAKEGVNSVLVRQTDVAGNVTTGSALNFTLDTLAPKTAPGVALAQDIGSSSTDHKTNNAQLSITLGDGGQKAQYSLDGGTTWSDTFAAKEGSNTVTVRQLDLAGNASPGTTFSFELDTAKPVAPTLSLTTDTGVSGTDKITQVGQTGITGVEATAVVAYSIDGGTSWLNSFVAKEGSNAVLVRQTDVAGNVSANGSLSFVLDTTAPAKPVFNVAGDNLINLKEQQGLGFTVPKLEAGATATVVFTDSVNTKVQVLVTNSGTSEADISGTANLGSLIDGPVVVTISAKDLAGNPTPGDAVTLTLDGITTPTIGLHNDSGSVGDKLTNDALIDVSTAPKDLATRTYSVDNGAASTTYVPPTSQGAHTVTVTDKDLSGNEASASVAFVLDTVAPKTGPDVKITDTGANATDTITKNGALAVTLNDGGISTQYSVDGGATWSSSFTAKEGSNTVLVRQLDAAGNASPGTSLKFTLDTTAPAAPGAGLLTDSGAAGDSYTNVGTLKVTAEEGASVEYSTDNGTSWSTSFAAKEGGNAVLVRQTDVAGNVSPNASLSFTLDTIAPKTAPGFTFVDTGLLNYDGVTKQWTPTLSFSDGGVSAQYSTDNGVTWASTFTPKEGDNTVLVRQQDKAGNASVSSTVKITLDTAAPVAPTVVLTKDAGLDGGDHITNVGTLNVIAEKGALVEYSIDNGTSWSASFAAKEGANSVLVRQTDVAGNVSGNGSLNFTLDTVAPAVPIVVLGTDTGKAGDLITSVGVPVPTVEKGALAEYSIDNGVTWSTSFTAKEGANTVLVRQTDVAGNVSASKSFTFTLDTKAPDAPGVILSTDSGKSGSDGYSKVGALSVTSEAKATVEYSLDGSTNWSSSFAAKEGTNTVYVRQTDEAGNVSSNTKYQFTLDTVAPASAPVVKLANDTGISGSDGKTYDGSLAVTYSDGGVETEYSTDNGVTWSKAFTSKEGLNAVMVRQLDLAGNASVGSAAYQFTLDTTRPAPVSFSVYDTGSSSTDKVTASPSITSLTGMEANNATYLEFSLDGGNSWSTTFSPVPNATNTVQIRQVDWAGNKSEASSQTFYYDTSAPVAADIVVDGGDLLVNLKEQPALGFTVGGSQKVEAGGWVEVTFTDASSEKHSVTVKLSNNGTSATSLKGTANLSTLADGAVSVDIVTYDAAGNGVVSKGSTLTLDGIQTPTIQLHEDTGTRGLDGITSNTLLDVSKAPSDLVSRTYAVSTDGGVHFGNESATQPVPTVDGSYVVRVTDKDLAGNVASATVGYTRDTVIAKPDIRLNFDSYYDQGASQTDRYTNQGSVGASNLEPGAYLEYSIDGGTNWTSSFQAVEGINAVQIRQTDGAGNTAVSEVLDFTLDTKISTPTLNLSTTSVDDTNKTHVAYTESTPDADIVNSWVTFTDSKNQQINQSGGNANLSGLSDGTVTAVLHTQDIAGNVSSSVPVTLQLHTFSYTSVVSASGNQVVLQFNKAIDSTQLPTAENFRLWMTDVNYNPVLGNGHVVAVTNVAVSGANASQLVLTLGQPLSTTGTLQVAYGDYNQSDLASHHLLSTDGSQVGWFYDTTKVNVAPTITMIRSTHEPEFDLYSSQPGDTLDLQVYFSEPVKFTKAPDGSTPTLTVTVQSADGSKTNLTAVFSPWSGFNYDNSTVSSTQFKVQLSDKPALTGSWSITSFNLNGATVTAGQPGTNVGGLPLVTSLANTVPDFAANAWLAGPNMVDLSATNGVLNHSVTSTNEILDWTNPSSLPGNLYANVKAGSGTRDAMVVPIILTTPMTDAEASVYHVLYNDTTKVVNVYKEGVATPVQSVSVPQGSAWPSGVEILYFSLKYMDSNTGEINDVNGGDEGIILASKQLAYEDAQRPGDVFIQATGSNDTIDLSTGPVTLASGAKHTFSDTDRVVIQASSGNDTITGSIGKDTVVVGDGNKTIRTGAGNDAFMIHSWDLGTTTLDGGADPDTLKLELSGSQPFMQVDATGNISIAGIGVNYATNPAQLTFGSTEYTFALEEASNNIKLTTPGKGALGTGNYTLTSVEAVTLNLESSDQAVTAALQVGTVGNDVLTSNGSGSVVFGGKGNDVLKAMGDRDVLVGGTGDDNLVFNANNNGMISGGDGLDTAVVLAGVWGPLVAKAAGPANSWFIVNPNDQSGQSYFRLDKNATTGVFTLYTLPAADSYSGTTSGSLGQVLVNTTLAGVESLKITSPDGQTLGIFDLSNPTAAVGASLKTDAIAADGMSLTVDFGSSTLASANLPDVTAFSVVADDRVVAVTGVAVAGTKLTLSLSDPIKGGHVYVHYADPSKVADTKALHMQATGADLPAFSVDAYLPGPAAKITSITTEDSINLAANASADDSMPLYVHFNSQVSVTAAKDTGLLPTLAVTVTRPDGSTYVIDAPLLQTFDTPITNTDVLRFEAPLGLTDIGTVSIASQSLNLHGATIVNSLGSTNANVAVTSDMVPTNLSNTYFYGGNFAQDPATFPGSSNNDIVLLTTDNNAKIATGDFSGIAGGSGGNRDSVYVAVVLPATVTDGVTASQYELRYNGSGTTKYVELWKYDGQAAVQQIALPDAAHWPAGVEILEYNVIYRDPNTGDIGWTGLRPMSFSQNTIAYGSGTDFTVQGSMNGDTINVASGSSLTLPNMGNGSTSHAVLKADHILILGNTGNDTITGHDGVDVIGGGAGNNTINAGDGDDLIVISQGGANIIDGEVGKDTVHFTLVGNAGDAYIDAVGTMHISGAMVTQDWDSRTPTADLFTLSFDEATANTLTLTDLQHGNAVSKLSNIEALSVDFTDAPLRDGHLNLTFGSTVADNLTAVGDSAMAFGGAGDDTLTARGESVNLFGGSGNDTLNFSYDTSGLISGGAGTDKAVLTIGSQLSTLTMSHQSGSMVWSLQDAPNHTVFQLEADTVHGGFALDTASGTDLGYGTTNTWSGGSGLSSIETLVIQNSVGTALAKLQLDEINHTVTVLPV